MNSVFTFKTEPRDYQRALFMRIYKDNYHGLFLEMGMGKSKLAIDLLRYKHFEEQGFVKTLVVCPAIAQYNWKEEFEIHSNLAPFVQVLTGTRKKRLAYLQNRKKTIFIVNFEMVSKLSSQLCDANFRCLIVDESHKIKNHKAKTTIAVLDIARRAEYKWILSGTPILNSAVDIFPQIHCLDQGKLFGRNFYSFKNTYFEDKNRWMKRDIYFPNWQPKKGTLEALNLKLRSVSTSMKKEDYLHSLPEKIYKKLVLDMPPDLNKAYRQMQRDFITYMENGEAVTAQIALTKLLRLMQISSGYVTTDEREEIPFKSNPKLDAVLDLVETITSNGESKVIIWAEFKQNIRMLKHALKKYNPAFIHGETGNQLDKKVQEEKFKKVKSCKVCICHPKSAGIAINLIEAGYAIYYSQNHSLGNRKQSEDRNHRLGSEKHFKSITYIDLVYKNSVDEIILNAIKKKVQLADHLLEVTNDMKRMQEDNDG